MDSFNALHAAAYSGNLAEVNRLLDRGFDPSAVFTLMGRNALHLACMAGHTDIVKVLIKVAVPVLLRDNDGYTPLGLAQKKGQIKVLKDNLPEEPFEAAMLLWDTQRAKELTAMTPRQECDRAMDRLAACYVVEDFRPLFVDYYGEFVNRVVGPTLLGLNDLVK